MDFSLSFSLWVRLDAELGEVGAILKGFLHVFVYTDSQGGGHFHINLYGTCRFSGYHFQHKFLSRV